MSIFKLLSCIIVFFFLNVLHSNAQIFNPEEKKADSLSFSVIDVKPAKISVERPEGKFITETVKVLNRGSAPLSIYHISPSCKCAHGKILNSTVHPLTIGKIEFSVNLDGLDEEYDTVEFIIESNAKNSPTSVMIKIAETKKDSLDTGGCKK